MRALMNVSSESNAELERYVETLAERYCANPREGREAGFVPEYGGTPSLQVGDAVGTQSTRSDYDAWLYGVASNVLMTGTYEIVDLVGGRAKLFI